MASILQRPPARRSRFARTLVLAVTGAVTVTTVGACTSSSNTPAKTASTQDKQTITFWHGYSQPVETKTINDNIAAFEKAHPNITVKAVANVTDDKILQGIRSSKTPDVISSFNTLNVGAFCRGALIDMNPLMQKDGLDKSKVYVKTMADYSSYQGKQCSLPLLGDVIGLYYNKDMFAKAGIAGPPKTWTELKADAVKLTKPSGSSYSQLGIMPTFHGYQNATGHTMAQWGPQYFDASGKPNLATDPAVSAFLTYHRSLLEALGGFKKIEAYRGTFGEEFSTQNAFEAQKVAMQIDGEWRTQNLDADVKFGWAAAPLPVPDDKLADYGRGWASGTIIGIPAKSTRQAAAWEFVKYLTTDTQALVRFANAIHNVPSTYDSLNSPDLNDDKNFQAFVAIAKHPKTVSPAVTADGDAYLNIFEAFAYQWEAGRVSDLAAGLRGVDAKIETAMKQSGS